MQVRSFCLPMFLGGGKSDQKTRPVDRLKKLLKGNGYHIFNVDSSRRNLSRTNDMIAVRPKVLSSPVWIYQRRDTTFVVRPFIDPSGYSDISNVLSSNNLDDVAYVQGGTLPISEDFGTWVSWVQKASQKKAQEIWGC